jgi:hypothetical protein
MSSWDKNARRKGEKAGSVWEKKSKKCVCFVTSHHERNSRRRIAVTSSFNDSGRKGDGVGKALLRPPHPSLQADLLERYLKTT